MNLNKDLPFENPSSEEFYSRSFYVKLVKDQKIPSIEVKYKEIDYATVVVDIPNCGATGIPLKGLRSGYRSLPLYDVRESLKIMGVILIKSSFD